MIDPKLYQEALLVQSACNLSGVVYAFAKAMDAICKESNELGEGTSWKNHHAICRLFAEQIFWLTSGRDYRDAHNEAATACAQAGLKVPE